MLMFLRCVLFLSGIAMMFLSLAGLLVMGSSVLDDVMWLMLILMGGLISLQAIVLLKY